MEQEKELHEKKMEWLTAELKTKTEELLTTTREKGTEILELQGVQKNSKEQVTHTHTHAHTVYWHVPLVSLLVIIGHDTRTSGIRHGAVV